MSSASAEPPDGPRSGARRTAVLVIHGIGSQRPLETMRAAADAIFTTDPDLARFRKPGAPSLWMTFDRDSADHDIDLPMFTTPSIDDDPATPHYVDFHECYWAHVMGETRFVAVPLWLFDLIRRSPRGMVPGIRPLWPAIAVLVQLWIAAAWFMAVSVALLIARMPAGPFWGPAIVWTGAVLLSGLCCGRRGMLTMTVVMAVAMLLHVAVRCAWGSGSLAAHPLAFTPGSSADAWVAMLLLLAFVGADTFFLLTVVGDAARYYRASPANIAVRREARRIAVDRLDALHRDPAYDRIVVVAHSLGTVIGYDMLRAYWARHCNRMGDPGGEELLVAADRTDGKGGDFDPCGWRDGKSARLRTLPRLPSHRGGRGSQAVQRVEDETAAARPRWIVSDFVTLGSPLAHAQFLMSDGTSLEEMTASFERKRREREFPQDPAWRVGDDGALIFRFDAAGRSLLHSAALFGMTRWTNLYFPLARVVMGDLVGGPLGEWFGAGIDDVALQPLGPAAARLQSHVRYFERSDVGAEHLVRLRDAVDLARRRWSAAVPRA